MECLQLKGVKAEEALLMTVGPSYEPPAGAPRVQFWASPTSYFAEQRQLMLDTFESKVAESMIQAQKLYPEIAAGNATIYLRLQQVILRQNR